VPSVTLRDGARIAFDDHDFTDPWIAAEPVVLVHGFSKNRLFWYEWVPPLARRFRVVVPDQRGHGDSSLPPPDVPLSLDPFVADLVELLDRLELDAAHFVMAEFSSSVAIELAVRHPERVRTLTVAGFGYNWRGSSVDWRAWAELASTEGSEAWARATNHLRLPATADAALREWYVTQQARVPGWLLARVFELAGQTDLTGRLPLVRVPTLILTGGVGQQETADSVRRGVALIPGARLVVFDDAPFNVMNACPERAIAETLAFLATHARGQAPQTAPA
jgi:3-oxoadipate enol-lactonase